MNYLSPSFVLLAGFLIHMVSAPLFAAKKNKASSYDGPSIAAKFASEELEGDFMTVWGRKFADHMKEWSGGKIKIDVYPYGTLGKAGDINELCQMNIVQFVFSDYAWISSFVPEAQVLALNYLFPTKQVPETLDWMVRKGEFFPLIKKSFAKNKLYPMSVMFEGWQWVTSNKKISSLEDMKGLKLRTMSSKLLVENYKAYGASPTPMNYGEVYGALQLKQIDGQVNPLFAIYSMKFFEVQKYLTQLKSEPFIGIPTVNKSFFDGLPKDVQKEMTRFWVDAIKPAGKWIHERNKKDRKKMEELSSKSKLTFVTLEDKEIEKFKKAAQSVYPKYKEIGGKQAPQILKALQSDIEKAHKSMSSSQKK